MIVSTQGTLSERNRSVSTALQYRPIDDRFWVYSTSSGRSALGTAVTASGTDVLKARSKKKIWPNLERLRQNSEKFHYRRSVHPLQHYSSGRPMIVSAFTWKNYLRYQDR